MAIELLKPCKHDCVEAHEDWHSDEGCLGGAEPSPAEVVEWLKERGFIRPARGLSQLRRDTGLLIDIEEAEAMVFAALGDE